MCTVMFWENSVVKWKYKEWLQCLQVWAAATFNIFIQKIIAIVLYHIEVCSWSNFVFIMHITLNGIIVQHYWYLSELSNFITVNLIICQIQTYVTLNSLSTFFLVMKYLIQCCSVCSRNTSRVKVLWGSGNNWGSTDVKSVWSRCKKSVRGSRWRLPTRGSAFFSFSAPWIPFRLLLFHTGLPIHFAGEGCVQTR